MALDRFINNVRTGVAKRFGLKTDAEIDAFFIGLEESAKDNLEALEKRDKMLRDAIAELCEAKRLLKAAVEDNKRILRENFGDICQFCKHGSNSAAQCLKPHNGSGSWCCENAEWRHTDEALTLIGKDGDTE